jgi:hypothetical protein
LRQISIGAELYQAPEFVGSASIISECKLHWGKYVCFHQVSPKDASIGIREIVTEPA